VTADAIIDRLKGEWPVISESRLSLAIVAVAVGCLVWLVVHFLNRRQIADLKKRLELQDDQIADAKAQIERLEEGLKSLAGERQVRQNLEALLASLREQLAIAQGQLMAVPRPTVSPSRESSRQSKFDELFGQGNDGEKYRPAVLAMALGGSFQIMAQGSNSRRGVDAAICRAARPRCASRSSDILVEVGAQQSSGHSGLSALRAGSPSFPPPQLIRRTVRLLLRGPRAFRVRIPVGGHAICMHGHSVDLGQSVARSISAIF
jgi:hypothetical protein